MSWSRSPSNSPAIRPGISMQEQQSLSARAYTSKTWHRINKRKDMSSPPLSNPPLVIKSKKATFLLGLLKSSITISVLV